jgi:hypothetical protein
MAQDTDVRPTVRSARTEVVAPPRVAEHVETVAADPYAGRRTFVFKLQQGMYLVFGVVEMLIAIRFALRLLGANPSAPFVTFIYDLTAYFIAPFVGIFGTPQVNGSVFEPHAIVGIIAYALLAMLLVKITGLLFGETRSGMTTTTRTTNTPFS